MSRLYIHVLRLPGIGAKTLLLSLGLLCSSVAAAQAPFSVPSGLLNQANTETLGLHKAQGTETVTIFSPSASTDHFSNGVVMTAYKDYLYCQWQSSATDEDSPDTRVVYSRSMDGISWSAPMELAASYSEGYSSSGGWWVAGDTLVAYVNVWPANLSPRGGFAYYKTSVDGLNWSELKPVRMADGSAVNGIFEQDPHALPDGRIINAVHFQPGLVAKPVYTDDPSGVRGWKAGAYTNMPRTGDASREMEPSWFRRADGGVVMIFRDQNSTYVKLASLSTDRGQTWSSTVTTNMPDSRSKQSAGNLPDGTAFIVGNPVNTNRRSPLVVALSADGQNFNKAFLLRAGGVELQALRYPGKAKTLGYSYPKSMIHNGYLYVAYSVNKEDVQYTRVPVSGLNQVCVGGAIDACGRCTGGSTGLVPCTGLIQAEDACYYDGTVDNNNAGFSGTGFVNTPNEAGARIFWTLYAASGLNTILNFTYANGAATNREATLLINGVPVATLPFGTTGSWTAWHEQTVSVLLNTGINTVELVATSLNGIANLDRIVLADADSWQGGCDKDCNGTVGGTAFKDQCGSCVGGATGLEACVQDCNGDWGGSAYPDDCGVCVGGTTGFEKCGSAMEAEEACDVSGILAEDRNTGFSGAGYVNTDNETGAYADWLLRSFAQGSYTITFRYANGGGDLSRDAGILIDGNEVALLAFPPTGQWTSWANATITLELAEGEHMLRLEALTEGGLPNLDILYFSEGVQSSVCTITGMTATFRNQDLNVYPNPATGIVRWGVGKKWILLNIQGKILLQGFGSELNIADYTNGVYLLKLENSYISIIKK